MRAAPLASFLAAIPALLHAQSVTFVEKQIPTSISEPLGIVTGSDGSLWFTESLGHKIGRITTAGILSEFPVTSSGIPYGIAAGPDGALWFTENTGTPKIGRITTTGVLTEFTVPSSTARPKAITAGPDGALWFTEYGTDAIGRVSLSGSFTEYSLPNTNSFPEGITQGPDGALWFTEQVGNRIGRITTSGIITRFAVPTTNSRPEAIVTGPDGALWFTEFGGNKIGRITTSGVITEFPIPTSSAGIGNPFGLTIGPDGALWFTESDGNKIARINLSGAVTEYPLAVTGSSPQGIATGPDGALWFTERRGYVGRAAISAGNPCVFSLPQASQAFSAAGGAGTATVRAAGACAWTASSAVSWITITSGGGTGIGAATFSVAPNPSSQPRSGVLTIANLSYTVNQAGSASLLTCAATVPATPQVSLEGRTELLGDLLLSCTGLTSAVRADITVALNTNVTNATAAGLTDATLTVNGANLQSGVVAGYNSLRWPGVLIAPVGGASNIRISRVRADASSLAALGNFQPAAITGQVSINAGAAVPVSLAVQTMATASLSFGFTRNAAVPPSGGAQTFVPVVFQETRAAAFQSGVTRLRVALANVPSTVQIYAPVFPSEGASRAQLYSADPSGAGGSPVTGSPLAGSTYQQLTISGGGATATWLVLAADAAQVDTFTFPLVVTNAGTGDLAQIQASASLAPVSSVSIASSTAPVPRYRDLLAGQLLTNLRVTTALLGQGAFKPQARAEAPVTVGSNVTFVSQVQNDADDPAQSATNVTIRGNLPTGVNLVSCTTSSGAACGGTPGQVQVNLGTLAPGQTQTVTVVAQIDPSVVAGAVLEDAVTASSDELNLDLLASIGAASFVALGGGSPVVAGGSPAAGSGLAQSFTFQFSDPAGYQNLDVVNVLINNFLDGRNACYLAYSVSGSRLYLVNDAGQAGGPYAGTVALGDATPIQNSQCAVTLVSALGSGSTLTLALNVTFKPSFGGNRIAYVAARDAIGGNSDWQALGVWRVPFAGPGSIAVSAVAPGRGASPGGASQQIAFTFTDTKGAGDFGVVNVLINNFIDGRKGCYLAYSAPSGQLILINDTGDAGGPFAGSMPLNGGSGSIQNSQCMVSGAGSSVAFAPNTMTLTLNITFKSAFAGNRVLYAAGRDTADGNNTDWQAVGTWTVQ